MHLPTIIVQHSGERPRKCTVTPLCCLDGFLFYRYPLKHVLDLNNYVRLGLDGEPLSHADAAKCLLVLDANWRRVMKMEKSFAHIPVRSLPSLTTAYPRHSKINDDPAAGLATIEAIYAALTIMQKDTKGILDAYHWRDKFLELNRPHEFEKIH